jgi:hypothetical protein
MCSNRFRPEASTDLDPYVPAFVSFLLIATTSGRSRDWESAPHQLFIRPEMLSSHAYRKKLSFLVQSEMLGLSKSRFGRYHPW